MHFRTYSVTQGLPQASVSVIVQDATGYFWLGTQDGLARFDGYEFKAYRHDRNDPTSISDNYVRALVAAADGSLWVTTRSGGLNHYSPWRDRFEHIPVHHEQAGQSGPGGVSALALDSDQRLWIVSDDGILQWLADGESRVQLAPLGQQAKLQEVRVLQMLPDGSALIAGQHGLFHVDAQGHSMQPLGPPELDVYALALGKAGSVWVGTAGDGVFHLSHDGKILKHLSRRPDNNGTSLPDNEIRSLLVDRRGMLWIGTNTAGLSILDLATDKLRHFPHRPSDPHSIAANRLASLYESRRGLVLIGSWTNGFSIHDPATEGFMQIYSVPDDPRTLPASPTLAVYGAADGGLWAGVIEGGGLVRIDLRKGVVKRYTNDPKRADSLANNAVRQITAAHDGGLWVATIGGGLDHLRPDGSGFEHLRHDPDDPQSLSSDSLRFVYVDSRGTLWVATANQGLDERCAGCSGFRHHRHVGSDPRSLASNSISALLETRNGEFWVATRNGGLDRLDRSSGRFEHFTAGGTHDSGLSVNSLTSLFEDSHGQLWVGTQGGALNRQIRTRDGSMRFETIDRHNGLDSDAIGSILEDAAGNIWVSTLKGISRVDPKTNGVINFSGHTGASPRGYWINSATYLRDGRLVFGGLDGIIVFDPTLMPRPERPKPVLTEMRIAGKPYLHGKLMGPHQLDSRTMNKAGKIPVTLEHDQNDVSFEFSALEYANPESIEYAYRLDGHDPEWVTASWRRRVATYTGLAPGAYTVRVRARSGHGAWSGTSAVLAFRILDPPWRTPLAYLVYALVLLLLAMFAGWRVHLNLAHRRQVQETIRESEARLKMALWGSGTELWDIDLRDGRMYRENKLPHLAVSEDTVNKAPEDILPYLHPEDRPHFRHALLEHLKQRSASFEASYRTLDRNNQWVWVLSRGQVVKRGAQGRALRISGISSNINALKQAEAALRALNQDLENRVDRRTGELNARNSELRRALDELTETQHKLLEAEKLAALGGLVAGIAHEINTPLGVALTAASFLHDETRRLCRTLEAGSSEEPDIQRFGDKAGQSADIILRNLKAANRLIASFKQVAVAQHNDDTAVLDMIQCVEQVLVTLGPMIKRSRHRIELDCAPDIRVEASAGALFQIITNLVTNAMLHGFDDAHEGTMRIRVRREGDKILLRFSDNGKGMSEEIVARLYEPFFTTRRGQGGSGLGLPIVYNLVTQVLKGSIEVHSSPGQGSEFVIRFPVGDV